jgi:hypothetical protein
VSRKICHYCSGQGWTPVIESGHDPRCDGTCSIGCPVPIQAQQQCGFCDGGMIPDDMSMRA